LRVKGWRGRVRRRSLRRRERTGTIARKAPAGAGSRGFATGGGRWLESPAREWLTASRVPRTDHRACHALRAQLRPDVDASVSARTAGAQRPVIFLHTIAIGS
jgi:hypothetical protein